MARRVLHLVSHMNVGGIETYVLRVLQHTDRRQWQMDVCCKTGLEGTLAEQYRQLGGEVYTCPQSYFNPLSWLRLWRLLRSGRYDAVCDYTGDFAGIPLAVARLAGVQKRVAFYRSAGRTYKYGVREIYVWLIQQLLRGFATDILGNSKANLDVHHPDRDHDDPRFGVIPNGIPIDEFECPDGGRRVRLELGIDEGVPVVGHVGGLRKVKNHATFVEAASLIRQRVPNAQFVLVGEGKRRGAIEAEIRHLGLSEHFHLLGLRRDVPAVLNAMDVFMFLSIREGMPNALVEAMAAAVPFVASDIAEIVEIIPSTCRKYLVDPHDAEGAAQRVCRLLADREESRAVGQLIRQWARERFSIEQSVERLSRRLLRDNPP